VRTFPRRPATPSSPCDPTQRGGRSSSKAKKPRVNPDPDYVPGTMQALGTPREGEDRPAKVEARKRNAVIAAAEAEEDAPVVDLTGDDSEVEVEEAVAPEEDDDVIIVPYSPPPIYIVDLSSESEDGGDEEEGREAPGGLWDEAWVVEDQGEAIVE
jgi:hypothetical protein